MPDQVHGAIGPGEMLRGPDLAETPVERPIESGRAVVDTLTRVTDAWRPTGKTDKGEADAALRGALAAAYAGGDCYARAVAALCTSRLILPTVEAPEGAEPGLSKAGPSEAALPEAGLPKAGHEGPGPSDAPVEGHPEMAAVLLQAPNGDKGVLVFTGYDALNAWQAGAHPVRCTLDDVAATCHETGANTILVDVAGPHPLVIERGLIDELAQGHRLVELPDGGFGWMWVDARPSGT